MVSPKNTVEVVSTRSRIFSTSHSSSIEPPSVLERLFQIKSRGNVLQSDASAACLPQVVHRKLVKRHILIEGVDYPVAPGPHVRPEIILKPIAVRVAGTIEPTHCHAFAVVGRCQVLINHLLERVANCQPRRRQARPASVAVRLNQNLPAESALLLTPVASVPILHVEPLHHKLIDRIFIHGMFGISSEAGSANGFSDQNCSELAPWAIRGFNPARFEIPSVACQIRRVASVHRRQPL